ncbi:Actin-like ATPase domain-containing protein [Madurella fahalii]|uniref:Actin-like ATPase domain-containing protein n=1 Tax=Madurella fahalii TaxID=1157608 RepID=A0ABQ0GFG6_9PEZI
MSPVQEADLTVGIDFGMTCTGVAFAKRHMDSPRMIQEWPLPPEKRGTHNKVPSTILYGNNHTVKEWGFTCNNHRDTVEWFKRYLEEKTLKSMLEKLNNANVKPPFETLEQVRRVYGDYMKCLYQHISDYLQKNDGWNNKTVEFVFSLPATFRSLEVSNALMQQIKKAGFGSGGKKHRVSWGLSEPQASAVYTAKEVNVTFSQGNIILVCDAGGGTTDLALLQQHGDDDVVDLRELAIIQGNNIGSTNIDLAFGDMVKKRLAKERKLTFQKNAASIMMHSDEFQTWKHEFGKTKESQFGTARVTVPIVSGGTSSTAAGISDGKMNFSHKDFRSLFDPEVEGIIKSIRDMIDTVAKTDPNKKPDYLVLSGGLGSSAYVQQRVKEAFPDPKVVVADADEPQLAVVKGLVLDRKQKAKAGRSALRVRKARASYGVVTRERYDKNLHAGKRPVRSDLDGELYVDGQVKWVIKKGDDIDAENGGKWHGFSKVFNNCKHPGISKRELVICHKDRDALPISVDGVDVFTLCTVESDLSEVDPGHIRKKAVKKSGFGLLKRATFYYEIEYEVKFVVGAIDARFELWIGEQEYAGKNSFKVDWEDEGLRSSAT